MALAPLNIQFEYFGFRVGAVLAGAKIQVVSFTKRTLNNYLKSMALGFLSCFFRCFTQVCSRLNMGGRADA